MTEYAVEEHQPIALFLGKHFGRTDFRVFQLAGDASDRRYFRVVLDEQSYVLMVWQPFTDNDDYPFLSVLNHFANAGVSVPKVYAKSPESGLILLEDLGDLTLERKVWENQNQELVIPYYRQALDQLYKINFLEKPNGGKCTAFENAFTKEKFLWEFNFSMKHYVKGFCEIKPSAEIENELANIFGDICDRLLSQKQVICHRDFHSRNLMIKLGNVRVIDFQDARLGPVQYDLVSLFKDSYVPLSGDIQNLLLKEYYDRSKDKIEISWEEFNTNYQLQCIQRCFKVCGSFTSFLNLRNDTRYIKYMNDTVKEVHDSLKLFPEYSVFFDFLNDNGLFDKEYALP